jgi:hypothetical protein
MSRRGNPNWGRPLPPVAAYPTEFERLVKQLRLTPQNYADSVELRRWCQRNKNRCYIPERLLQEWGIEVELSYGNDATLA